MNTPVKGGIALGILTVAWTFVMGFMGWYKDPALLNLFFLVILIQLAVMIVVLRHTGRAGATYGKQIINGLLLSAVGAVIIFIGSYLYTAVVFPQYFEDIRAAHADLLRSQGKTEAEIATLVDAEIATQTPLIQALSGVAGTMVTGLVFSLIIGIFTRKKN